MTKDRQDPQDRHADRHKPTPEKRGSHTVAEWVSLVASALLILTLAGFLVFEALQANEPFVPVEIETRFEEAREISGRYVLPVRVANRGGRTLREVKIELRSKGDGAAEPGSDVMIDYLGEGSEQTAYFYLDQRPAKAEVEARALSYRVE